MIMGSGTRNLASLTRNRASDWYAQSWLNTLQSDRRGFVAVMMGLMLFPIMAVFALSIEFASVADTKMRLTLAADAAAVQAVMKASQDIGANPLASLSPAQAAGVQQFAAQVGNVHSVTLSPVTVAVTHTGATFTATVSYTGVYTTFFGNLVNAANVNLAGQASAAVTNGPYVDIQVMLDVSSSMLIAGTPTDITSMSNLTLPNQLKTYNIPSNILQAGWWANSNGCAFACHWDSTNKDFYGASRTNNITLRLDQLKSAIQTIANTVSAKNSQSLYRLGLYTFEQSLAQVAALTTSVAPIATTALAVQPPVWPAQQDGHDTKITESIYTMASTYVSQGGNGAQQSTARKFVFLMTDGIEDIDDGNGGRIESPLDPAACAALKAKGVTIAVLHTAYYNPYGVFNEISAIQDQVTANLKTCASDYTLYFPVDTPAQLNAAVQGMLNQALAKPAVLTH